MAHIRTRTTRIIKAAGKIAAAVMLAVLVSASGPGCKVFAQGATCGDQCRAAFGACYKATANRSTCEQLMQRCLERCIQTRRD